MKKAAALVLALALAVTGTVSALAGASTWVDEIDLEGYKVVEYFNYNESSALRVHGEETPGETMQSVNPFLAEAETVPKGDKIPSLSVRYVISGIYAAGFTTDEVIADGGSMNVVPVDLTVEENTAFVYPVATNSHVVIGLLYVKVNAEEGYVQVEGQYKDQIYDSKTEALTVYTAKSQLAEDVYDNFVFNEPISIDEDLDGASAILVAVDGQVTYPTLFGRLDKLANFFAYQDYYRYENWAKSYRTAMTSALGLVAD